MIAVASIDRLTARAPALWRALAAMLVLCGLILIVVESRARILRNGAEIRLRTAPVDQRDLFRGDYVVLAYDISTVRAADGADRDLRRGEKVYVSLRAGPDGFAQVVAVARARPSGANGPVIGGRVLSTGACLGGEDGAPCAGGRDGLRIAYGIETYFVPQGSGRAIERTDRSRIEVVAAVSASGDAAIKRLLIDGRLVHAEPPY